MGQNHLKPKNFTVPELGWFEPTPKKIWEKDTELGPLKPLRPLGPLGPLGPPGPTWQRPGATPPLRDEAVT